MVASLAYSSSPEAVISSEQTVGESVHAVILSAVPDKRIKIIGAIFTSSMATGVLLESGGTKVINIFRLTANTPFLLSPAAIGYGQTDVNEDLTISHEAGGNVSITFFVQFVLIP